HNLGMFRQVSPGLLVLIAAPHLAAFPVPKGADTPSLAGSTFVCTDKADPARVTFAADGKLLYRGNTNGDGTWKQDGNKLTWSINNYSFHEGVLDGDTIKVQMT